MAGQLEMLLLDDVVHHTRGGLLNVDSGEMPRFGQGA